MDSATAEEELSFAIGILGELMLCVYDQTLLFWLYSEKTGLISGFNAGAISDARLVFN